MKPQGFIIKDEAAKYLGVQRRTIDNMMRSRRIAYYKFGRSVLFKEHDLNNAVERSRVESSDNPSTAHGGDVDVLKQWTSVCQWLRLIQNGKDEKHAMLAKDCLKHIEKFIP